MSKTRDLMVCTDCIQLKDGMRRLTRDGEQLVACDSDRSTTFRQSACDCCGSALHGERHHAALLQE